MKYLALFLLKCYKYLVSPVLEQLFGKACKYEVTCSEYAIKVIAKEGIVKGGKKSLMRLASCNSWTKR